jgi:hypothetical protein
MEETMTLFNKVIKEHGKKNIEVADALDQETSVVLQTFSSDFHAAVSSVARPIFEEFVSDAIRNGFPSGIEEGADGNGNPFISVRFIPERGTTFGVNRSIECSFFLKGNLSEQKVEHEACFDQRKGNNGTTRDKLEIQSLNKSALEKLLTKFLRSSLSTRDRV